MPAAPAIAARAAPVRADVPETALPGHPVRKEEADNAVTKACEIHALGAHAHGAADGLLHGPAEGNPALQLLGHALGHLLRQKVNPHGLRVGIIKDWDSRWFANKNAFGDTLVEDYKLREYIKTALYAAGVPKIEIPRWPWPTSGASPEARRPPWGCS